MHAVEVGMVGAGWVVGMVGALEAAHGGSGRCRGSESQQARPGTEDWDSA